MNIKNIVEQLQKCTKSKLIIEKVYDKNIRYITMPRFYVRIFLVSEQEHYVVQFAVKKYFDRWANSTNFATQLAKSKTLYKPNLVEQYKWMCKVIRSGLFNFNRYFHTIDLPWFSSNKG